MKYTVINNGKVLAIDESLSVVDYLNTFLDSVDTPWLHSLIATNSWGKVLRNDVFFDKSDWDNWSVDNGVDPTTVLSNGGNWFEFASDGSTMFILAGNWKSDDKPFIKEPDASTE